jgi:hypothetical protein
MAMSVAPRMKEQLRVRAEHPSLTSPVCVCGQPTLHTWRSRLADTFPSGVAKKLKAAPRYVYGHADKLDAETAKGLTARIL